MRSFPLKSGPPCMPYAVGLDDPDWTDARLDFKTGVSSLARVVVVI